MPIHIISSSFANNVVAICVFLSSSRYVNNDYLKSARELANSIYNAGYDLVWGGANIGPMGEIAKEMQRIGGIVRGILPKSLLAEGLAYENADELIITKDMSTRKNIMNEMSEGYIAFPGGFGTMEEILEVITLKQLGYHTKPIVFLNINDYFTKFIEFVGQMIEEKFVNESMTKMYFVCNSVDEAVQYILNYQHRDLGRKW